jgi:hypothetical protein
MPSRPAIDQNTFTLVYPSVAFGLDKLVCPVCEDDVILQNGKKNDQHFSHREKVECDYYVVTTCQFVPYTRKKDYCQRLRAVVMEKSQRVAIDRRFRDYLQTLIN